MAYGRFVSADELNVEDVVTVADFRSALRKFLRYSELVAALYEAIGGLRPKALVLTSGRGAGRVQGPASLTDRS
jgi:hypothetical protein